MAGEGGSFVRVTLQSRTSLADDERVVVEFYPHEGAAPLCALQFESLGKFLTTLHLPVSVREAEELVDAFFEDVDFQQERERWGQ